MDNIYDKYEAVIGLEVHIQLLTKSKAFSSDANEFGAVPNTNVSVVTLAHPGTLPRLNKNVLEYAVKLGLACHCEITEYNTFARKNYFYADLPKGYQISQDKTPVCKGGYIAVKMENGKEKKITLTRIHIEEDAGKSIHDVDPYDSLIDLNRAGVPLLEIVSEPDIRSGDEAYQYLSEIRKLVRYLEVCDGNMEEGSMRCDANISVRLKDVETLGRRTEVKNMNSIRNVQRAIKHEVKRQIDIIEKGGEIAQDTLSFDATTGTTFILRSKEMAHDYRYFPEPDLQPVRIKKDYIERMRKLMPPLPSELFVKYTSVFGLSDYDAGVLTDSKPIALYFEKLTTYTSNYKAASNWITVTIKSYLNEHAQQMEDFPLTPEKIAQLIRMIDEGKVSNTAASQKIFPELIKHPGQSPHDIAKALNLLQESDSDSLKEYVKQAIAKYPEKVIEYKNGKKGLVGLFMGEVMKISKGKADPKVANKLVVELLEDIQN